MASKYASVLTGLSELPVENTSYQDKIDLAKKEITNKSASGLAHQYALLRDLKNKIEDDLSATNLQLEAYTQMLVESNNSDDPEWGQYGATQTTLRLVTGDKIEVRKEPYAQVVDKDANRKWAMEQGLERMLSLPWQTVNSLTKEALLKGEAEPEGVKAYVKTKIVFTAMKVE